MSRRTNAVSSGFFVPDSRILTVYSLETAIRVIVADIGSLVFFAHHRDPRHDNVAIRRDAVLSDGFVCASLGWCLAGVARPCPTTLKIGS